MNLIGGIDRPTSGSVVIDGKKIFDMNESEMAIFRRRNIGIVYQFYNLIPNLTVDENIMLPVFWTRESRMQGSWSELWK